MKVTLDLEKMKLICKISSPHDKSADCQKCPLNQTEACSTSLICLSSGDLEEINKVIYNYKIPTYKEWLSKELPLQFCSGMIAESCTPWEVYAAVDDEAIDWNDPVSLDFVKKFYSED